MENMWNIFEEDEAYYNNMLRKRAGLRGFEPLANRLRADCST